MKLFALLFALTTSLSAFVGTESAHAFGRARHDLPELTTVSPFEVERYLGRWYEIASFPQSFQKGCTGTIAEYSLIDEETVRVLNSCFLGSLNGKLKVAEGKATIPDLNDPSKLEVSFFWPFKGAYWVIELGENYEYSVVGHPSRDYLWILSRTPQMSEEVLQGILARTAAKGFDLNRLKRSVQPE